MWIPHARSWRFKIYLRRCSLDGLALLIADSLATGYIYITNRTTHSPWELKPGNNLISTLHLLLLLFLLSLLLPPHHLPNLSQIRRLLNI